MGFQRPGGMQSVTQTSSPINPAAIEAWMNCLGPEHVVADQPELESLSHTTLPIAPAGGAILRPASTEEVISVVRIASQFRIPLYPISRGRNWGYGDACPVTGGQVVLDLGRMNRIIEVNAELGYAVIEPGVTQGQLKQYLEDHRVPLLMDCTGAGPETSIIGNVLERGFGHTPYGNRFQNISGVSLVLADATECHTGFGHYQNARATYVYPAGIGPMLDGLFSQSNMGIVTRMGFWLMPEPECFNSFVCLLDNENDLGSFVDELRDLKLRGTIRSVVHIANDMRVIASKTSCPVSAADSRLSQTERKGLRDATRAGAWSAAGSLQGSKTEVAAARRTIRKRLRRRGRKIIFMTDAKLGLGRRVARLFRHFPAGRSLDEMLRSAGQLHDLNRGIPTAAYLKGAYWKHRAGVPEREASELNPGADGCGLMWIAPISPMTGADVTTMVGEITGILDRFDQNLFITLSTLNDRSMGAVVSLSYDKESETDASRAQECYDALFEGLARSGFLPYRVGIQSMRDLAIGSTGYWDVVRRIKTAVDPEELISPGRYDPIGLG